MNQNHQNIELRHLRYFLAVAEELNFGRAAERLNITQPSLSRQIQNLEKELCIILFERNHRQIKLTALGQVFVIEVEQILARFDQGIRVLQRASRGEIGQLTVGFQGSSVYDVIPLAIKAFRDRFPGVEVIMQPMETSQQVIAIAENNLDVGFVIPPITDASLEVEILLQEPLVLALPENHPLAAQSEIAIASLANEPLILASRDRGCGLHEQIFDIYQGAGLRPNVVCAAREMQVMLGFVAAGMGISLLPSHVRNFQRTGVIYRQLIPEAPIAGLGIAWKSNNPPPVLSVFLEIVRSLAK
ncbi:LysR family transcriptional regulator [Calothrix sp. PCC 6303]|uniref:LysR family transcriptional regulator n=1 Tax=Calothrix sp. PCC 6303 TaxID=1170562 RepID=UPI0002A0134C|nr:LysR family transcriptional regulator [Calothrix sp. PCC 6303]AFZ04207.1 transcriptional regulator, LysR family [Calothrix sp. PCC 6303]